MKILIYVSSYLNTKASVLFGGLIARATGADVTLLTVIDKDQDAKSAHEALYKASWWLADIHTKVSVRRGTENEGILEEVSSGGYDLVILKTQKALQPGFLLAPQINRAEAQQLPISFLVVKRIQPDLKQILICTRGKAHTDPAVEMGAYLARATLAQVTLLHVGSSVPIMDTGLDNSEEQLSDFLQKDSSVASYLLQTAKSLTDAKVDTQLKFCRGVALDGILLEIQSGAYDLIVIGDPNSLDQQVDWLMGNDTQRLLSQIKIPALIVRQKSIS